MTWRQGGREEVRDGGRGKGRGRVGRENFSHTMIVRRSESVFLHRPSGREYNEVSDCHAGFSRGTRQDSEYRWILKNQRIANQQTHGLAGKEPLRSCLPFQIYQPSHCTQNVFTAWINYPINYLILVLQHADTAN